MTETTYEEYRNQASKLRDADNARVFYGGLHSKILEADPLYAKFIDDTAAMYQPEDKNVAWAELIGGYELLAREGKLPKLDKAKFKEMWDAIMNRAVAILNVGVNLDLISADNPVYLKFIIDSTGYFPQEQRVNVMSDLSCGYMFLIEAQRAK